MYWKYQVFAFTIILLVRTAEMRSLTKGPFKTTTISVKGCVKTTRPRLKPEYGPVDTYWAEIYNTTKKKNLIRGNITLNQHNTRVTLKTEGYMWKNDRWKRSFSFDIDCDSPMMTFFGKMTNLAYDSNACTFTKGVYWFTGLDLDKIDHFMSNDREYGRELRKNELLTKYNTLICAVIETLVEPEKK